MLLPFRGPDKALGGREHSPALVLHSSHSRVGTTRPHEAQPGVLHRAKLPKAPDLENKAGGDRAAPPLQAGSPRVSTRFDRAKV